jgi:hypothetical protein
MKFKIQNIETLIVFFNKHFDKISDAEYSQICFETLQVFTDKKPKTKEAAIKTRDKLMETPFFM